MKPETKTLLLVIGSLFGVFLFPAILILLREFLLAIIFIVLLLSCFILIGYYSYIELLPIIKQKDIEELQIAERLGHDPEKIRFYKGFKKYFDGELTPEGLQKWLETHPVK